MAQTVKYAEAGSNGNRASEIGWIDFTDVKGKIGIEPQLVVNELKDGGTISFYISCDEASGYDAEPVTANAFPFGTTGYTGVTGQVTLETIASGNPLKTLRFSNITIKDTNNNIINDYTMVIADAQQTLADKQGRQEYWKLSSIGGTNWDKLDTLSAVPGTEGVAPSISSLPALTVTTTGQETDDNKVKAYVFSIDKPSDLIAEAQTIPNKRQIMALGVIADTTPRPPVADIQIISCDLEMQINKENRIINVCPRKAQYFTSTALKCCGDGKIIVARDPNAGTPAPVLGSYILDVSGILFIPAADITLKANIIDILPLIATDSCGRTIRIYIRFVYEPDSCCVCCKCR